VYRFKQFFGALTARIDAQDQQLLARWLPSPQRHLFFLMTPGDQRHSLNVHKTLHQAGYRHPDLLRAALLHDVGKSAGRVWLWQRTLIVLLKRWWPGLLDRLARGPCVAAAPWWRRGFVVNRLHAELGARWAAEADCSAGTVALIRQHQQTILETNSEQDELLAALQWADGVN
jgi:hypothetical protein